MITLLVTLCLLLPAIVCDSVLLYLASDNDSPLPLFDDGSAAGWLMEGEEEPGGEQSRKIPIRGCGGQVLREPAAMPLIRG